MGFTIREIEAECKFSSALTVDALSHVIPEATTRQVIAQEGVGEVRERRLTAVLTVWLVIALHLFPTVSVSELFRFDMVLAARQRGAHVLSRLPAGVKPLPLRTLPDGSLLAYLLPSDDARRRRSVRILVRIITYTINDPALPGYGEEHRLITTLLNPRLAPAVEVACGYHERWEIELVIDEIDTHQRLVGRTLRSLTPVGVIQELYGLLLAHYAVRVLMHEAALRVEEDPDRLSFVHALEIVCDAIPEFQQVAPTQHPALYARMLREIAVKRLPERRLRINARVVKRKMSNFRLKRAEHDQPPKPQRCVREAVVVQPPPVIELPHPLPVIWRLQERGGAGWGEVQPLPETPLRSHVQ